MTSMKTGILGGTFNPIHLAHLGIATEAERSFKLDRVLFLPAAEPPHKSVAGQTPFVHRLAMVEAAINGYARFAASDLEMHRSGKSFSVDTLKILRRDDPESEFYFIIGLDSYRDIASWKNFEELFGLCHLVITTRPGVQVSDPLGPLPVAIHTDFCYADNCAQVQHKSGNFLFFLKETNLDISSTQIRGLIARGEPIRHLVPEAVADYIEAHHLYRGEPQ